MIAVGDMVRHPVFGVVQVVAIFGRGYAGILVPGRGRPIATRVLLAGLVPC